ncbi:low affinity iron permease family protein [Actinomadura scrupuli]|uniref:low affinity iron permease family protein n=1 Tax=Actinomadura scrupuli TaxID=559629 RepID=UPI003D987C30
MSTAADTEPEPTTTEAAGRPARTRDVLQGAGEDVRHHGKERFSRLARRLTAWAGSVVPAAISALFVVVWLVLGVFTGFPHWWQVVLTETSAAITLSMVFVIQHATNRQSHATALKLDELLRAIDKAGDHVVGIENRSVHEQEELGQAAS